MIQKHMEILLSVIEAQRVQPLPAQTFKNQKV